MRPTSRGTAFRIVLLCAVGIVYGVHSAGRRDAAALLAGLRAARAHAARVTLAEAYRPCRTERRDEETIPRAHCGALSGAGRARGRIAWLSRRVTAEARGDVAPAEVHAAALVDLLSTRRLGIPLERSISYLRTAAALSDRPAAALADLSAALLVRAEWAQDARSLLEALETAERALEREPENAAARFNRALALDRLGLDGEAAREWEGYLMVDSTSGWASEARGRARALRAPVEAPVLPPNPTPAQAAAFAADAPQEARLQGWGPVLGGWAESVLRGEAARAAERLALAAALGEALEGQGGDAGLADAVRAIRAVEGDRAALGALARAHQAFAAGLAAHRRETAVARRHFDRALEAGRASPALRREAEVLRGAALAYDSLDAAQPVLRRAAGRVDTARHPALAAQAHAALGSIHLRGNRYAEALAWYDGAARLYADAGERESLGAVEQLTADTRFAAGDGAGGYAAMHRALLTLRPYRGSVWLHNLLVVAAEVAADDGLPRAAVRIQDEGVAVAARTGQPMLVAEAHLARAGLRAAAGQARRTDEDVAAARELIDGVTDPRHRSALEVQLMLAEAGGALPADPERALEALTSALDVFGDLPLRLLPALFSRAEAALSLGRVADAEADLRRALAMLDAERDAAESAPLRAARLDGVRDVFDRMAMLRVSAGRPDEALAVIEQGRASLAPGRRARGADAGPLRAPPGEVAVDYALIGDTLLIWTLSDTTLRLARDTVSRAWLVQTVERARSALERGAGEAAVRPELARLHDVLVRPVQDRLGPEGTPLVVVADGEVAGVPLAALYDARRGRYLVRDHPVRHAATLREAARTRPARADGREPRVFLVADPAFDRAAFPGVDRLGGAEAEAAEVARVYADTGSVGGARATRAAVLAGVREAEIVHYAGHAFVDDARPGWSHLLLAPDTADPAGRLSADDVGRLSLPDLRLLVLSACQTAHARDRRSGGFNGLAGAFLAAGAGGVVGSLWKVDDRHTHALMREFHRAYRRTGDGPGALRAAQLQLLRSRDPALRSPAAWAGFRYAGQ